MDVYNCDIQHVLKKEFSYNASEKEASFILDNILNLSDFEYIVENDPYSYPRQVNRLETIIEDTIKEKFNQIPFLFNREVIEKIDNF